MQQQQYVPVDEAFDGDDEIAYRARLRKELTKNWSNGFCRMPDLVRQDRTLSAKAKILYEQLLSYMWFHSDHCWPSQQTLAEATGYSRRSVIRACQELYERGYIEKWRRGQGSTNVYCINPLTFPHSFHRTKREPVAHMILSLSDPALRENVTNCTPHPLDASLTLCQVVTSRSDSVSPPEVTTWHTNQRSGKQIHGKEMDSNDSSLPPQKRTDSSREKLHHLPGEDQATENEQQHEISIAALLQQQTEAIEREQQRELQQWRQKHDANQGTPEHSDLNKSACATINEAVPPVVQANSSASNTSQGNGPENAKQVKDNVIRKKQTKQAAIAATTGIPEEHLEELAIATSPQRRPIPAFLKNMISHFSQELGDHRASEKSNITQAAKLYFFAHDYIIEVQDDPQGFFTALLYQAKADAYKVTNVRYRNDQGRPNRMPVFFTCLQKALHLTEEELLYVRSDEPLFERAW